MEIGEMETAFLTRRRDRLEPNETVNLFWSRLLLSPWVGGRRRPRLENESRNLVFSPSRSNLGLVSSRFAGFVRNREKYNLGMVSGPVLLKIKGKS